MQLYFRDPVAEVTRPLTELLDWEALVLLPGEKGVARFAVTAEQFAYFGRDNTAGPTSARSSCGSARTRCAAALSRCA